MTSEADEKSGWIKCSEGLPEHDDEYQIWPRNTYAGDTAFFTKDSFDDVPANCFYYEYQKKLHLLDGVTHWQRLPPLAPSPKDDKL